MGRPDYDRLMAEAVRRGADEVELYYEESDRSDISVYQGRVENMTSARARGVGVRVFRGQRVGFSYTSDLSPSSLSGTVAQAVENAALAAADRCNGLPDRAADYPVLPIYEESSALVGVEDKIRVALDMEREALAYHEAIDSVPEARYTDTRREVVLVSSRGDPLSCRANMCVLTLYVVARRDGAVQSGVGFHFHRRFDALDPGRAVREAAEEALSLLGGRPVPSQDAPVVFHPRVGAMLMSVLGHALVAEAVQKGRSLFAGKVHRQVASPLVTLIDDGCLLEGALSAPFDGEGVPSRRKELIAGGNLMGYLYDTYTARKDGVSSTGNASRPSFRVTPEPAPTNLYLAPGTASREDVIGGVDDGFYVMEVSGLYTGGANPVSGDFSLGASGRWIRNGELAEPVREVTIAGNLMQLLLDIDMIGDDLEFIPVAGSCGSSTFRVKKLAISGQ